MFVSSQVSGKHQKLCSATTAFVINTTVSAFAISRLQNTLNRVANMPSNKSCRPEMFHDIAVFKNFAGNSQKDSQENTCARVLFFIKLHSETCDAIKKETLALVFSC